MKKFALTGLILFGCMAGWTADYLTDGYDNARTGWVKDEKVFNKTNVKSMKLLWKVHVDSTPRQMHSLMIPLIAENVTTGAGKKEIALIVPVQREREKRRYPLVSIPPFGRGFSRYPGLPIRYVLGRARKKDFRARQHRLDEPAGLSLGMVASLQSPLPFHPAKSL